MGRVSAEYLREWRRLNRDKHLRHLRNYRTRHREQRNAANRNYKRTNADAIAERQDRFHSMLKPLPEELYGLTVVSIGTLKKPRFIFEYRGVRKREYWPLWTIQPSSTS